MAEVFGVPRQPVWLVEIGRLEATRLSRPRDGVAKLREAIQLDPRRLDSTLALADTLAAVGGHEEAAIELRNMLLTSEPSTLDAARVATMASMLVRELEAVGRQSPALVAEELMAFLGYGATDRIQLFRSRSLPELVPVAGALDRPVLERAVIPAAGQNVFLRIAAALDEISHKLFQTDLAVVGASSHNRLASRSAHPLRLTAERAARVFGPLQFDLYMDVPGLAGPRVLPGAPAAVLIPPNFDRLPGPEQVAGFARLLAYVAMAVPWLDEVAQDDLDGILFGSLHVARPGWDGGGLSHARDAMASMWKPRIARAIGRKTKRLLEELADEARLDLDPSLWRQALRLASWRCAYLATGDWLASFNHAWRTDPQLGHTPRDQLSQAAFAHPILRELIAYGLSSEPAALLRAVGV
jgi:hypothetical protein